MQTSYIIEGKITSEQPLATCSKDLLDREGGDMKPVPVPSVETSLGRRLMFPATGLRGSLRRAARDLCREKVIEMTGNVKPFSLDEHYLLTLGGIKGQGEQDRSSVAAEAAWRDKNPVLSLFGAGDAGFLGFVSGRLSMGNAICRQPCEPDIFSGSRTDEFYRNAEQIRFLSDTDVQSLILKARGGRSRSEITQKVKATERQLAAAKKNKDTEKESQLTTDLEKLKNELTDIKAETGTSDVSVGMPLAGYKAIPAGQEMDHRMMLHRATEIELGLFLATLNQFALYPLVGAHRASGCGTISAEWEICEVTKAGRESLGSIRLEPFHPLVVTGKALKKAMAAFENFMESNKWDFSIPQAEAA